MIKKFFPFLIPAIFALILISCNDSPTDLGVGYVDNLDGVGLYKFSSDSVTQSSNSFEHVYSLGGSARLLIGKAENASAYSMIKYKFSLADTIIADIKSNKINVLDSWVSLVKDYKFGDSSAAFDYNVYKINSGWSSSTFSADSFNLGLLSYDNVNVSSFRETDNDTLYTFHLDTTVTSSWLHSFADTSLDYTNYGILISPKSESQKVLGFSALSSTGEDQPLLTYVIEKPGVYIDTVYAYTYADISFVTGNRFDAGPENLVIQSSLSTEAKLFFDLSSLPKDITINSATLTLTVDTLQTKVGKPYNNALTAYLIADSTIDSVYSGVYASLSRSGATFTGKVTELVRTIGGNITNQGFIVKASSELYGIEIFAIKGSNAANVSQRPKLEIVFSRR